MKVKTGMHVGVCEVEGDKDSSSILDLMMDLLCGGEGVIWDPAAFNPL